MTTDQTRALIIIGAGGHGRVVADIARKSGLYDTIGFLDDEPSEKTRTIGKTAAYVDYLGRADFAVAIGNAAVRRRFFEALSQHHARIVTLIHPQAVIGENVVIGRGTVIAAGAVVNPGARIGDGVIINTSSSVDHDCMVGDFCHISVGAHLAGTVTVGEETFIGAGAIVINNMTICGQCTVGAGAVVVRSITEPGTYIGVPAKRMMK